MKNSSLGFIQVEVKSGCRESTVEEKRKHTLRPLNVHNSVNETILAIVSRIG